MTKDDIVALLNTNDRAVGRALLALTALQTQSEQRAEHTIVRNGVGFTPADARVGTSMGRFFEQRGYLTPKQIAYWRKPNVKGVPRICKYAGQLLDIAKQTQAAKELEKSKADYLAVRG